MGNFQEVTLGGGVFKYDSRDIGFIKGDVTLTYEIETKDFEVGVPLQNEGTVILKEGSTLKVPMAQMSINNLSMALGGKDISTGQVYDGATGQMVNLGLLKPLAEKPIEFIHTSPVSNKKIAIKFWKSSISGGANISFKESDWAINEITFKSIRDATQTANPGGFIFKED